MCGSDYPAEELKCPYCGAPNEVGIRWKNTENEIMSDIAGEKLRAVRRTPLYVINKVLNVIIVIMIISIIGLFAWAYIASALEERKTESLMKKASVDECEELMRTGEYQKLQKYLRDYKVYGETAFDKYTECVRLYDRYQSLIEDAFRIWQKTDWRTKDTVIRRYEAENLLGIIREIIAEDRYTYSDIRYEENKEYLEKMKRDAAAIAIGTFDMTGEEIKRLAETDGYSEEYDEFVKIICERKGYEYDE